MPKQKKVEASKMTIKQLLSQLRVAQLWTVLVVIVALITGSFSFGYQLSSSMAEANITKLEAETVVKTAELQREISELQTKINYLRGNLEPYRGLETKERFLALYLRYLLAKENLALEDTPENQEKFKVTQKALESLIIDLWSRHEGAEKDVEISGLILGKGPGREATVKFLYDGSIWPIPQEFQIAVLL